MRGFGNAHIIDKDGVGRCTTLHTWDTCFLKEDPSNPHYHKGPRENYESGNYRGTARDFRMQVCACVECREFYLSKE